MSKYDVVVLGAGPGGYVSAIQAAQNGLNTAIVEKADLGGVCLNWGCIPTKALISSAHLMEKIKKMEEYGIKTDLSGFDYSRVYKDSRNASAKLAGGVGSLLKKNKVDLIKGVGVIDSPGTVRISATGQLVETENIIIATGSRPREIPGFEFNGNTIISSKDLLNMSELPESIIILGAGAIGIEFAYILNAFGVRVLLIEMLERILPSEDFEISNELLRELKKQGIEILTGTKAVKQKNNGGSVILEIEKDGKVEKVAAGKLLVGVGRRANIENLGLERNGIEIERGVIRTGDYYKTNVKGIYAIGDVAGSPMLAHAASHEGVIVADYLAGKNPHKRVDSNSVPRGVYCEPQTAGVGLTEQEAKEKDIKVKISKFPFIGCGKAVATGKPEGFVKILSDSQTEEILGASIIGSEATELIQELVLAKNSELLSEDVISAVHGHPTLSEAIMEAARGIKGKPIHI